MVSEQSASVIIPCYKQAHFLSDAIESVLAQTVQAGEIIVIDDGSPDHPELVCELYPSVRYHRQENKGVSMARNRGLSLTRGSHVIFLDADDMLLPNAIEMQLREFRARPGLGLVFGAYEKVDENARPIGKRVPPALGQLGYEDMLRFNVIGGPAAVMFRRDVLEEIGGFDPTVSPNEDYELFLRVSRSYPILGLGCELAKYRYHAMGHSRNLPLMLRQELRVVTSQWPWVCGDQKLRRAYFEGLAHSKAYYGGQIYWSSVESARIGDYRRSLTGLACLAANAPLFLVRTLCRHVSSRLRKRFPRSAD